MNVLHIVAGLAMTVATVPEFPSNAEMQAWSRWFGAWECPTFKLIYFQPVVPRAKYALGPRHAAILFTIHRDRVVRIEWFEDD